MISDNRKIIYRGFRWLCALTYCGLLTYLLLSPDPWKAAHAEPLLGPAPDPSDFKTSTALHVTAYFIMGFLWVWALRGSRRALALFLLIFGIIHGIGTEMLQSFVPNRWPSFLDATANIFGFLIGWWGTRKFFSMRWVQRLTDESVAPLKSRAA